MLHVGQLDVKFLANEIDKNEALKALQPLLLFNVKTMAGALQAFKMKQRSSWYLIEGYEVLNKLIQFRP